MTFEKWYKRETDDNKNNIDDWKGFCKSAFEAGKGDIADLKANFDYVLEGKDLEIKQLGERCNQLLKDKGNLTDELANLKETLAQTVENDEVAYETLKLHDEEEIGMLNSRVAELEQQIEGRDVKIKELELELTVEKDQHQEEINLHLHAEEYIKSLEEENNKLLDVINNQDIKIADLEQKLEQTEKDLADYQFNYPKIKELEKVNAELKEKLNIRSCQNCKHNNKSCPNDGSCKHYSKWECRENPQLAKAKEIIREIMKYEIPTLDYVKAEQFIKDIKEG